MNFNYIDKRKIDKDVFNELFSDVEKNYQEIVIRFYKIATIIANRFGIREYERRQDLIQDSVFISIKRINNFSVEKSSAYSYFFKVILNNFKDIMRKKYRRKNIATMVSYETTQDNVVKVNYFDDKKLKEISGEKKTQTYFVNIGEMVNKRLYSTSYA